MAVIGAGSGFEPAPSSYQRWRHGQARLAGRSARASGEAAGRPSELQAELQTEPRGPCSTWLPVAAARGGVSAGPLPLL